MNPANDELFNSDLWKPALEKYASATHVTVKLFDANVHVVLGPIHPTPLFQMFDEKGYDPGLFAECARRCLAQTENRPTVVVSKVHGLAVIGTSLVLEGKIVGAAVAGYVFLDFSQVSEIQRIAREAGIGFERLWQVAREQKPVPQGRLTVNGQLLQVLGDNLLLQRIVEQRTAALRELSSSLLRVQDEERRRIARELHDSTGQDLSGLQLELGAIKREVEKISPDLAQRMAENVQFIGRITDNLRTMSYLLHPPMLDELGLRSAVDWYVEGFSKRSGIQVELKMSHELQRLPDTLELVLFRILQESLTNILRHSQSRSVDIELEAGAAEVTLQVRDHGRGVPPELLKQLRSDSTGVGVGLRSMHERISELGGLFAILSDASGTSIRVTVPLPNTAAESQIVAGKASGASAPRARVRRTGD